MNATRLLALAMLATTAPMASAQTCDVLADINQHPVPLSSVGFFGTNTAQCNGLSFFAGSTVANGLELWSTTGAPSTTHMVADIAPGADGSKPSHLFCHNGLVFFVADDGVHGREIWRSDGTSAGTWLLKDIGGQVDNPGDPDFIGLGGHVYFSARSDSEGAELWRTDGTPAGTQLFKDIRPGPASSSAYFFTADPSGTGFYFQADDGVHGAELWHSDGTSAGTAMVADILAGSAGSSPTRLVVLGSQLLFAAYTPGMGYELWTSDGTAPGTTLVADILPGPESSINDNNVPVALAGRIYFQAYLPGLGDELWSSDGTTVGTGVVQDLTPGPSSGSPRELTALAGKLFFSARQGPTLGTELYSWDPATSTLALVKDINTSGSSSPKELTSLGGQLYFQANSGALGAEPWTSDGTASGTVLLGDLSPGIGSSSPSNFMPLATGGVAFSALDPALGFELFQTPGGTTPASLLVEIEPTVATASSNPSDLKVVSGSTLYFAADDGITGKEPYRWDPIGGAVLLKDIFVDPTSYQPDSDPKGFTQAWLGDHERVFFSAESDAEGREPWVTDGTPAGTHLLKNISFSTSPSNPEDFTPAFGKVFFSASDGDREPWVSDGTLAGTFELADLAPGSFTSSNPTEFTLLGDQLLFSANDGTGDVELYVTDGTAAGTQLLKDIGVGYSSNPRELTRVGDKIAFMISLPTGNSELWRTDGTAGGTEPVSALSGLPGAGPSGEFVTMDGVLYFGGRGQLEGLWRSDLTTPGTVEVKDLGTYIPLTELTPAYGRLFFSSGGELFVSDGTASGTMSVSTPPGGNGTSNPAYVTAARDGVFYAPAFTVAQEDRELYFSNGTPPGTFQACNIGQGTASFGFGPQLPFDGEPAELVLLNGDLVFAASDLSSSGRELWRFSPAGSYVLDLGISGNGHQIEATQPSLGSTVTISGSNAPSGQLSLLGLGFPLSGPSAAFTASGSAGWLDPLVATPLFSSTTPTWSYAVPIVPSPALAGLQLVLQSWTPGSSSAFPASTSNGLLMVLGA